MTRKLEPDEARKLLSGYATGSLSLEDREALFAAALDDQELFDALAEEDALRELLDAPGSKTRLLAAIDKPGKPASYWFGLPWLTQGRAVAFGGLAAMAALTVAFLAQKPAVLPLRPAVVTEGEASKEAPAKQDVAQAPVASKQPAPAPPQIAVRDRQPPATPRDKGAAAPAPKPPTPKPDGAPAAENKVAKDERASAPVEKKTEAAKEKAASNEPSRELEDRAKAPASPQRAEPQRAEPRVPSPQKSADSLSKSASAAPKPALPAAAPPPPPVSPPAGQSVAGFRAGPAPVVAERRAPSPPAAQNEGRQQVPPRPADSQRPTGSQQEADAAGGAAKDRKQMKASGRTSGILGGFGGLARTDASAELTLRYRLRSGRSGAADELTVNSSTGFVYILRRAGSSWDTVASGNGPHSLAENGEFAIVASRVELANPAVLLRDSHTSASDIVAQTSDGFTTVSSPGSAVVVTLRVRDR